MFGLLVGVPFDVAAVGGDDDQSSVLAVVVEALHKLSAGLGIVFRHRRMGRRDNDGAVEHVVRAKAPTTGQTEPDHIGGVFLPKLADGVQRVLGRRAADADLLPAGRPHGPEQAAIDGAVFPTGLQVALRRQRPPDARVSSRHHDPFDGEQGARTARRMATNAHGAALSDEQGALSFGDLAAPEWQQPRQ